MWIVQAWNGRTWRKVRGVEGGPYLTRQRAERIAASRADSPLRESSTEGMSHRVRTVEVAA
jgi:hypothetical protein